jgi:hypothetical protein
MLGYMDDLTPPKELMILPVWIGAIAHGACPSVMHADTFTTRVGALVEPVAFADDAVLMELATLEATLRAGCIEMTVPRETLGGLFMAQGANELLRGGDPQHADAYLRRAAALTAPIEPAYGLKVEEAYRTAVNGMRGDAILELSFSVRPDLVVVDGELVYDAVERRVLLGVHLVQWYSQDSGWSAEWVEVTEWGERRLVGGGPPLPDSFSGASSELPVQERRERARQSSSSPRPAATSRSSTPISVVLVGGYGVAFAPEINTKNLSTRALGFTPNIDPSLQLGASRSFTLAARYSPRPNLLPLPTDTALGAPRTPNELRALLGFSIGAHLEVQVGALAISQPVVSLTNAKLDAGEATLDVVAPSFGSTPGVGPMVNLSVTADANSLTWALSARVAYTTSPVAGGLAAGALCARFDVPIGPVELVFGAELEALRDAQGVLGAWVYPGAFGGLAWSR